MKALALALLLVLGAMPALAADGPPAKQRFAPWFALAGSALAHWQVDTGAVEDGRLTMRRKVPAAGPLRRVMVIYPRRSSAYDVAMSTMLEDFAARPMNLEFVAVNYGKEPERGARLLEEAAREGHALIYAMGSETVAWLHESHPDAAVPVVSVCAKDPVQLGQMPSYDQGSGSNFAFTSLNVLLEVQVEYLRELKPGLRNLAILVDARNASAVETQARPIAAALAPLGIDAFEVAVTEPAEARGQLAELVPAAVARMRRSDPGLEHSVFWITGSTSVFAEIATINDHAGPVPVLAVVPEVVQAGRDSAVLSIGVSFESNAQLAAVYGADILSRKARPGDLPVGVVSPPDIAVNFLRAREVGMKIPYSFFEAATFVYDAAGRPARVGGRNVAAGMPPQS